MHNKKKQMKEARFHSDCFFKIGTFDDAVPEIKKKYLEKIQWFSHIGEPGPKCICSWCRKPIIKETYLSIYDEAD